MIYSRHELHLPYVPYAVYGCHENINIKGILVFSSSISEWVFAMLNINTSKLWLCVVGEGRWTRVCGSLLMYDIHAFKGKIYMFHASYLSNQKERLYEIILHPKPKLMPPMLLETKNFSGICFSPLTSAVCKLQWKPLCDRSQIRTSIQDPRTRFCWNEMGVTWKHRRKICILSWKILEAWW